MSDFIQKKVNKFLKFGWFDMERPFCIFCDYRIFIKIAILSSHFYPIKWFRAWYVLRLYTFLSS